MRGAKGSRGGEGFKPPRGGKGGGGRSLSLAEQTLTEDVQEPRSRDGQKFDPISLDDESIRNVATFDA